MLAYDRLQNEPPKRSRAQGPLSPQVKLESPEARAFWMGSD